MADRDLRAAGAGSYAVLTEVATGLDWDKADGPGGQQRSELMLWSLVHGYATLRRSDPILTEQDRRPEFDIAEISGSGIERRDRSAHGAAGTTGWTSVLGVRGEGAPRLRAFRAAPRPL